jgi:hypothetical protein
MGCRQRRSHVCHNGLPGQLQGQKNGGEGGIRTLGPGYPGRLLSKQVRSTTPAPLRTVVEGARFYGAGADESKFAEGPYRPEGSPVAVPDPHRSSRPVSGRPWRVNDSLFASRGKRRRAATSADPPIHAPESVSELMPGTASPIDALALEPGSLREPARHGRQRYRPLRSIDEADLLFRRPETSGSRDPRTSGLLLAMLGRTRDNLWRHQRP